MKSNSLLFYKVKKQFKSLTFVLCLLVGMIFTISQFGSIPHIPLKNQIDLEYLADDYSMQEYVYKLKEGRELNEAVIDYLRANIEETSISVNQHDEFETLISYLNTNSIEEAKEYFRDNEYLSSWLMQAIINSDKKLVTIEEANSNIYESLGEEAYQNKFQDNYVTYALVIFGMLLLPMALFTFLRDDRYKVTEIIQSSVSSRAGYYFTTILSLLIPVVVVTYLAGAAINIYTFLRFKNMGYAVKYVPLIIKYVIFFLPSIMAYTSVIALLVFSIKRISAVIPIYLIWITFNATPKAFNLPRWVDLLKVTQRLDWEYIDITSAFSRRGIIFLVSIIFFIISYLLREKLLKDCKEVKL